jgi:3-methylcrotonyl-CoA carboxylase alpha subunit
MKNISKVLIANRGEIASRIIRTTKALNIPSVSIYSIPDRLSPFVREADEAFPLNGYESKETYLSINKILKIAFESGATAIHPGYGFLSENADFAREVENAGIKFIGPSSYAIQSMGDKVESRKKMLSIGVPIIPGYDGGTSDENLLLEEAKKIGFPVMIKASAGGGGRGMRRVFSEKDFFHELAAAKRESKNFFSNDAVFIEKLILNPRHIEVQIFGDSQGNVIHLYDRDCSIQRRNQKIIEEAPAPNLKDTTREKMYESAIRAATSINYTNAGTVEFVLDENEDFFFLEMNTRLQVEHPVTEMITGLDLVELQIKIAGGSSIFEALPNGKVPSKKGSAIELRICAEEETKPVTGTIHYFGIEGSPRIDSGVESGNSVSIYYDSMIAKVISFAETRSDCIWKSIQDLNNLVILGLPINDHLLNFILNHDVFQNRSPNTGFFEEYVSNYLPQKQEIPLYVCIACFITSIRVHDLIDRAFREIHFQPKTLEKCYVSDSSTIQEFVKFTMSGKEYSVKKEGDLYLIKTRGNETFTNLPEIYLIEKNVLHIRELGKVYFVRYGVHIYIKIGTQYVELTLSSDLNIGSNRNSNSVHSPMPGKIIAIYTKIGDTLSEGDPIISIESMKMENIIRSEKSCQIEDIHFHIGDQISPEDTLVTLKK